MDSANADSDHSMTWEDFFGSTTDLTPTLIGIYDSLLEPKNARPEMSRFDLTAKDARNDPPLLTKPDAEPNPTHQLKMHEQTKDIATISPKDPSKIAGSVRLPGLGVLNKSTLYSKRTKVESVSESDNNGAINETVDCVNINLSSNDTAKSYLYKTHIRSFKTDKVSDIVTPVNTFDNLSPNVKRMISSSMESSKTSGLKFPKKTVNPGRNSIRGHRSNIPLVGATSKISQSGVEILPSVEIYDQPCAVKSSSKPVEIDPPSKESPSKMAPVKADFKLEADAHATYDVPTNKQAIYDVPTSNNKTAFESLSLPYIDQSIELSITANDREFDIKLASKDNSPEKTDQTTNGGTNSLHRKDFTAVKSLTANPYPETIGSTGNLKLCSSATAAAATKEGKMHPPSVEVSRPLSMSSIASSSSTSSSGVQNKGGVNSAYLASIESLDDHSDADVPSADGSNNFVNSAGIIAASMSEDRPLQSIPQFNTPNEFSGLSQLERVCGEIVQTENVYVEDLRQVVEGYLHVWRKESVFAEEELAELFNNVEDIYAFNRSLCEALNTCRLEATSIAKCFVDYTLGFAVYTSYCTGYPRTMERLAALASRPHSARAFRERQLALGHPLPLASYLLKPVQRILKYHLLLQNVVKLCACRETEFALLKMTGIAQHIDDMKRKHEHAVRVQEIQSLLYGWSGPDLTTYGELCAEGTFRVFGAKAMRHVFLFDKMLLITKNREDGILAYKSHIMCNNMMLVEAIAGAPLSFHVIPWDAPRSQLTLQAASARHKREWTLLLKRVILENYNAVIPSHARQLVMELGQNKTDDDMLAEKSHNLITQASMRKQLSAPEYLEKRKLERERRKSFENGSRGRTKKVTRKHTLPMSRSETPQNACDCAQVSAEKGTDFTCDHCYVDLCSDCETELSKERSAEEKCSCKNEDGSLNTEKCAECDRSLHFIDAGSAEDVERKPPSCKCSDFKSSQESVGKEFTCSLNKTRGYHSSDNIVGYIDNGVSKDDLSDKNISSCTNVRNVHKTCLKCAKIKENIVVSHSKNTSFRARKSRCNELQKKSDTLRSKSKDDPQRSKLTKIGAWRRKSEPGLQPNVALIIQKKSLDSSDNNLKGGEKIEFECRNCGSNRITSKIRNADGVILSDPESDNLRRGLNSTQKQGVEIKMYNSKNIPKKISKLKKSRAKGFRLGSDTTAKFYADLSSDVSNENILHITESNDSLNIVSGKEINKIQNPLVPDIIIKDEDIDEETYKKLIEKTDSFKKNELEKVKYLNNQKVINEGSEIETESQNAVQTRHANEEVAESCEETEQPLEQIISQLLLQNREFQKLLKKQQLRNTAQRRHQRLLKSHSNPEQAIPPTNIELSKIKAKYVRQTSENVDLHSQKREFTILSPPNEADDSDNDHIYETLRVVAKSDEPLKEEISEVKNTCLDKKSKKITPSNNTEKSIAKGNNPESDYVYLSFGQTNELEDNMLDGIYDVPVKRRDKIVNVSSNPVDYYVTVEKAGPRLDCDIVTAENMYDNIVEVCRRQRETAPIAAGEYLPMSPEQQNPNMPEIWLSRQKEHFNVSRDRKSGSLPRSFQVITSGQDENNLSTFRCKPNSNSKTYLNRDGKVLSIDRPFTIASDQSEISYDDVENYMSDGDILKYNKNGANTKSIERDDLQNISQSTLELEEEIDRCYKNNFEKINLDSDQNKNLLTVSTVSQPNLNVSTTSSCEALTSDKNVELSSKEADVIHPEHKIYKPTSNMLSLKNVLSRFKNKNPQKSNSFDNTEINSNDPSSPDIAKAELKSPTSNEKRSALNPRSYSRNLLQRFRSIIGDEQPEEDNLEKSESQNKTQKNSESSVPTALMNEIKVVVTSTDNSPSTSTVVYTLNNDPLSRSVCENTTFSESQSEKKNLETLSYSCDYINDPKGDQAFQPTYEKSVSTISNTSASIASTSSPSKSNNSSFQSLNKLPIYMQGSKHLGARIAQSDYVDPTTFINESKYSLKNVNVLINKNAVRPDSLFSNSSYVTSSSEGTYQTENSTKSAQINNSGRTETINEKQKSSDSSININSDESYYEKSFEKIEHFTDEHVFRDSAVYSDQEDADESRTDSSIRDKHTARTVTRIERNSSFKSENVKSGSKLESESSSIQRCVTVTTKRMQQVEKINNKEQRLHGPSTANIARTKIAPPVPAKPKLVTNIPTASINKSQTQINTFAYNRSKREESSKAITNVKQFSRSVSAFSESTKPKDAVVSKTAKYNSVQEISVQSSANTLKMPSSTSNSIQIKRLSFERASLDSAARKTRTTAIEQKRSSTDVPANTSKSVLERRMEIESLSNSLTPKSPGLAKKPSLIAKPGTIQTKMAASDKDKAVSHFKQAISIETTDIPHRSSITEDVSETRTNEVEFKESWVKQVVNKFQ